jgi:hypothetical protein
MRVPPGIIRRRGDQVTPTPMKSCRIGCHTIYIFNGCTVVSWQKQEHLLPCSTRKPRVAELGVAHDYVPLAVGL